MPVFAWEGRTRQGTLKKGVIEASSEAAAMMQLRGQMIVPVSVRPKSASGLGKWKLFAPGVSIRDLVVFTRQFATMIDAGLPLVQCLEIQAEQQQNKTFREALGRVKADVEQGSTFAESLGRHPKIFDELYVNLVTAGEVGGVLDTILNRLAVYLEKADSLRRKVKSAMVYPTTVMVVAIGVLVLLLVKVIPVFEKMFKDFGGGKLPAPTQFVIDLSYTMRNYLPFVIAGLVAIFVVVKLILRSRRGRLAFDGMLLKLPVLGPVLRKTVVARFARTMGTLLASGVPILDSMEIVAKTAGNTVVSDGIMFVRSRIAEGKDLATPLMETGLMPPMVVQMISVGEQTGALDAMLSKIADFYEEEVDVAVASMTRLIEPLLMVFLGTVIGGLVIAMYMPIFEMAGNIKAG